MQEQDAAADEDALVARCRAGDRAAFRDLVERYQGVAYALALRMLGEPETAADVVQDALISAYRNLATLRGTAFRPWLLRIVRNGCYDIFRARGRHPESSLDALLEAHPEGSAEGETTHALLGATTTPEEAVLRGEVVGAIEAALLQLPPEQRLALILGDIHGLPYDEIARVMETPLGTVKSRIARARLHLRALLLQDRELFGRAERPARETTNG